MQWKASYLALFITASLAITPAFAKQSADSIAPEAATGLKTQTLVQGSDWMIASANPYASEAGAAMLRQGGNAIDAMVATQLVLGLVEPQSSGIGGGAFLMYWDAKKEALTSFDGRETAPYGVTPRLFQDDKGEPLQFFDAVVGGRSVGTPGTVKLLQHTHQRLGKLPWKTLFEPAINLAKKGFVVSPRLAKLVANDKDYLQRSAEAKAYFFNQDGSPIKAGQNLKNPAYADTLMLIADQGASAFYHGKIANDIVKTVRGAKANPGVLNTMDLATYQVKEREPICAPYRQYSICGMGPPSSGALTLGQIMGMLSHYPIAKMGPENIQSWRLLGDASRLAFADRGKYMADSDYVPMPTEGLLAAGYIEQRATLLKGDTALATTAAGKPPWSHAMNYALDEAIELPSTSHFSIVDKDRNMVSITTTIENGFGSRLMVRGFLLNNELTDFSFRSHADGVPIANRIEPGKRPRSSMAPTIVMKEGEPYMAVGSPGGSQIIGYVAKTLVAHLDWGLNLQQAINLPNMNNRFGAFELEQDTTAEQWAPKLEQLGFKVKVKELNSGVQAIRVDGKSLTGAADPRREGKVIAQ
ncbi:gamma-glutamyltransferase [Photobacterium profundum]|uniref:Glutathione hydrolase proenzyme n=1 Tax=Photobacterium profundum 3TCK TaxID=314280 RepID=Q1YY63_9GAMM|nr:gamma-glutamyltransferase [Photobacterium profundum]EAS41244.1 putative gamma-glutamyltranspeptidase [Photobacterium profundum 3TCK]PSV59619.1 gamma-glutamyltransferase [Photobacterium profundum]